MQQLIFDGWMPAAEPEPIPFNDFNALLEAVMAEARAVGIPVSDCISPIVIVNRRAKTRFGSCRRLGNTFVIELSGALAQAPAFSCRQILAHEVLHTCPGCHDHGARWRSYARRMGNAYGYNISRVESHENLGIAGSRPAPRFTLVCADCARRYERIRASRLTAHPERFRCGCGGKLIPAEIAEPNVL